MKNRAKITALCNQKGGVGKTVTAVNLGIGLAREGKRVLLADIDPQGSLTASLGYQRPDQMENTMAEILGRVISDEPQAPDEGIIHHAEGVDLLPANIELSGLEVTLVNTMSRETILRDYLNSVRDRYDVILLDCCPSLGMLTINALAAADEVIIPAQAHYLSLRGMEQLIRTISNVKRKINPALEIAGILITMADMRTNYSREIIELLRNTYGSKLRIFDSIIPLSIRAAETSAEGRSIYLHDPAGKVSAAYTALTQEVLSWKAAPVRYSWPGLTICFKRAARRRPTANRCGRFHWQSCFLSKIIPSRFGTMKRCRKPWRVSLEVAFCPPASSVPGQGAAMRS